MSFLKDFANGVANFANGVANLTSTFTGLGGLFNAASSLFNVFLGNNSADPPNASQTATWFTQPDQDNGLTASGTTTPEQTNDLNTLLGIQALLNAEQQQVPQPT
ncbi:MAG: hypothetical protein ING14_01170 [Burkholderiales bacterium]|nr:hypothetical protein [Burkholderiales bacterium]